MRHRRLIASGILGSALLLLGPTSSDAVLPDASCPGPPNSFNTVAGEERQAQWFTAQHIGTLVGAQLVINKESAGADFQIQVLRAESNGITVTPINGVLGAATIPDASVPLGVSTQTVALSAPVSSYRYYALVVTRPGGGIASLGMRNTNPCSGQNYFSSSQTGDWILLDPDFDLIFNLSVEPSNRIVIHSVFQRKITVILPSVGSLTAREARPARRKKRMSRPKLVRKAQVSPRDMTFGGYATLRMQLTRFAPAILKAKPKLKAQVLVTYTPVGGQPNTIQVAVPLRVPPR